MESHNHLGIYLRRDRATVVCIASPGRDRKLLDGFTVALEEQADQEQPTLAERIARTCSERGMKFGAASVALDCAMFMQHAVQSQFSDYKRIASTVRFDTEEVLATDVADVAVAFRIASSDHEGSNLDVFTTPRGVLSEILLALQSNNIDPVAMNPDVYCLSRYLGTYGTWDGPAEQGSLYALLSDSRGYLVGLSKPSQVSAMRAFPVSPTQDRGRLLSREVLITKALAEESGPISRLCVWDADHNLDEQHLAGMVGFPVKACDLLAMAGVQPDAAADCANGVDFALAYGAALSIPDKETSIDFRTDYMPYQGKKLRLHRALKLFSISMTLLFLAIGVFFHVQMLRVNRNRETLRSKFEPDYLAVMLGKRDLPNSMKSAVGDLERTRRLIEREKTGIGADESISARLTQVLQAINSCSTQTDLKIDFITITEKDILINASTRGTSQAVTIVFDALKKAGFKVESDRVNPKGDRTVFALTAELETTIERK